MAEKRPTPVKPLTIYFYHTRLTRESYEEWKDYKFPGHILYGLPLLEKYGIRSVMHKYKAFPSRLKLMFYATKEILCCKEPYEVLYGTSFRGLELIILLRALGLYRKPIVIWHHTALKTSSRKIRERISRFFYKGIDHMFLFSKKLIKDSLATGKAPEEKLQLIHWGPDLPDSVRVHYTDGVIPYLLAQKVARKSCVVICCMDFPYTVGLTTLVEAFALGIPVICSRNPNFEMDIDKEEIGITVAYDDVEGWINAIHRIADHPEEAQKMGANARKLAEKRFNLEIFSREIAESLLEISKMSPKKRTFA